MDRAGSLQQEEAMIRQGLGIAVAFGGSRSA
jgi:hypothetical protein